MPRHRSLRLRIKRMRSAQVRRLARLHARRSHLSQYLRLVLRPTAYTEFQKHRAGETFISIIRKDSK